MKRISAGGMIALIAVVLTLAIGRASGQGTATDADVLSSLLVEVRGLRAAMEQLASAGPRVQLALGRLQLQEQRLNTMLRRLDEIRERLAGSESAAAQRNDELKRMQEAAQTVTDPVERRAMEMQAQEIKTAIERGARDLQRLRAEEADLANSVAAEQARWIDINQRLEDLERTLVVRR
jgi:chromosome segregation ATPase